MSCQCECVQFVCTVHSHLYQNPPIHAAHRSQLCWCVTSEIHKLGVHPEQAFCFQIIHKSSLENNFQVIWTACLFQFHKISLWATGTSINYFKITCEHWVPISGARPFGQVLGIQKCGSAVPVLCSWSKIMHEVWSEQITTFFFQFEVLKVQNGKVWNFGMGFCFG